MGLIVHQTAYRGLPQGSCLSPILFNVYMMSVSSLLNISGFFSLLLEDYIVVSTKNKHLDIANDTLSDALVIGDRLVIGYDPQLFFLILFYIIFLQNIFKIWLP